ncbi:DsbA family protein [Sphingomonas colocasiae]|uniref:DsbA family protein n=1 Tax=Sphingomonas colocasiae TaxID=1848973 RepID=A0ABS7PXX7_9SPHN|nr:thioredoxin domain-containing protein [Sphingomonas colocasiae]MBY8826006.1 DsbA family protein [Sphingomonas colocasiae]
MRRFAILASLALAGVVGAGLGAAGLAAPARDWTRTAVPTKAGTYVFGNPAAKAKLVEYLSYTCSHCAHFTEEAWPALKRDYLARGTASIEVRHALRDPIDMAAALLARCDGPARFLDHSEAIFAAQRDLLAKGQQFMAANGERVRKLPEVQIASEFAHGSGLVALMRSRGMPQAKINACLANKGQLTVLAAMADEAWKVRKVPGTPAFLINGALAPDTNDWAALKPKLDAAAK